MKKSSAALVFWLMFYPASGHAAADNEILCKMYFVGFHWLYELFPTNEDLAQCIKDPAGWRDSYLGRFGGSSGGFRGGGTGPSGSSGRSAAPDATALGLCLHAILETPALDDRSRLGLTDSRSFLDGKTTIIDGAVELTDQQGAITAHDFHCKVEGREAASVDIRSL